MLDVLTAENQ